MNPTPHFEKKREKKRKRRDNTVYVYCGQWPLTIQWAFSSKGREKVRTAELRFTNSRENFSTAKDTNYHKKGRVQIKFCVLIKYEIKKAKRLSMGQLVLFIYISLDDIQYIGQSVFLLMQRKISIILVFRFSISTVSWKMGRI